MTLTRRLTPALFLSTLAACNGSPFDSDRAGGKDPVADNRAPLISGQPPTKATVGRTYYFRPSASDPDGDTIRFRAAQLPFWAKFDVTTGAVSGIPPAEAAGTISGVAIEVSDGELRTALPAFSIKVAPAPVPAPGVSGSATLDWTAPRHNDDGTPLTDLAGYRVYYGRDAGNLSDRLEVADAGASWATITDLAPGTWYFAVSSVNTAGVESLPTPAVAVVLD